MLNLVVTFETITCCNNKCGLVFAVPAGWKNARRTDHAWFYCPNGHRQYFSEESNLEREHRLRKASESRLASEQSSHDQTSADRDYQIRRLAATKGVLTRTKNRIFRGVCPCCNRHFVNLEQHMMTKHPDFSERPGD